MGRVLAWFEVLGSDIVFGAGRPPADGSAEIDGATAALGRKDGSGIYFPLNPLARITSIRIDAGVGTSLQRWDWIM